MTRLLLLTEHERVVEMMRVAAAHARWHGAPAAPRLAVDRHLVRGGHRGEPPALDLAGLRAEGIRCAAFTVNSPADMWALLLAGVDGLITDYPDLAWPLLREAGPRRGEALVDADGFVRGEAVDLQGHRGADGLRPGNTLPGVEAALGWGVTTIEIDVRRAACGALMVVHDADINPGWCRRAGGAPLSAADCVGLHTLDGGEIRRRVWADVCVTPTQRRDHDLSPVACAFAREHGWSSPYCVPTFADLVRFLDHYVAYHTRGPGRRHPRAEWRAEVARRVWLNVEIKTEADATTTPRPPSGVALVDALAREVAGGGMADRVTVQSFSVPTMLHAQSAHPAVPTGYLIHTAPSDDACALMALAAPPAGLG